MLLSQLKMTKVNYLSYVALAKACLPTMVAAGTPCQIVNVSSAAGKFGVALRTSYCRVKHALMGFFDALRIEESGHFQSQLHLCTVCPGSISTDVSD